MVTGVSYVNESDRQTFARVKKSGARFVHGWIRWHQVAPTSEPASWDPRDPFDPNYDWTSVDRWVTNAASVGLTPLLQIYYAPTWANRCAPDPRYAATQPPCNPDPEMMADFGYAAAKRYDGSNPGLPLVRYWQPQNEPNLALFFRPQWDAHGRVISPIIYRELLNKFYDAVKSVSPLNKVVSAGLAPNANSSAVAPLEWTRRFLCMRGRANPRPTRANCRVKLDIFDMHPYTSGGPTHKTYGPDNIQLAQLGKLRRLLIAADRAGRIDGDSNVTPLWVTEMSWDSRPPDPGGVPMLILRRWTSEAVFRAWQAGVDHFFWYSLRDQDPGGRPWRETAQSGLFFRGRTVAQDRPKPIWRAFRFPFVAFTKNRGRTRGMIIWGRTPNSTRGRVAIERRLGRRWVRQGVVRANGNGMFMGFVPVRRGSNRVGWIRARYRGENSAPFSLRPVKDRRVRPFG